MSEKLKETILISLFWIVNQIVCVGSFLSNFHPALVPPIHALPESDTDDSMGETTDSNDKSDSNTVCSSDHEVIIVNSVT